MYISFEVIFLLEVIFNYENKIKLEATVHSTRIPHFP